MEALDLETKECLAFVLDHLGPPPTRVLEIGCGAGELAVALDHRGHVVHALEPKAEAVAAARDRGVDVVHANFPEDLPAAYIGKPFDAVLYARSLHHMEDLDGALAASRELLATGGQIIVDDWAWEEVDVQTLAWFTSFLDLAEDQEWLELAAWPRGEEAMEWWRSERIEREKAQPYYLELAAVRRQFHVEPPMATPFFYRYVWRALRGTLPVADAEERALAFKRHEQALIDAGTIRALGRRFVGRSGDTVPHHFPP